METRKKGVAELTVDLSVSTMASQNHSTKVSLEGGSPLTSYLHTYQWLLIDWSPLLSIPQPAKPFFSLGHGQSRRFCLKKDEV